MGCIDLLVAVKDSQLTIKDANLSDDKKASMATTDYSDAYILWGLATNSTDSRWQ